MSQEAKERRPRIILQDLPLPGLRSTPVAPISFGWLFRPPIKSFLFSCCSPTLLLLYIPAGPSTNPRSPQPLYPRSSA